NRGARDRTQLRGTSRGFDCARRARSSARRLVAELLGPVPILRGTTTPAWTAPRFHRLCESATAAPVADYSKNFPSMNTGGLAPLWLMVIIVPFGQSFISMIVIGVPSPLHYRHIVQGERCGARANDRAQRSRHRHPSSL